MPIRQKKNGLVALRPNGLEQLSQLISREEVNSALLPTSDVFSGVCPDSGR